MKLNLTIFFFFNGWCFLSPVYEASARAKVMQMSSVSSWRSFTVSSFTFRSDRSQANLCALWDSKASVLLFSVRLVTQRPRGAAAAGLP